jgi:hypothetical protein
MNSTKKVITMVLVAVSITSTASTASAGAPWGLGGAYARRFVGPAIRQANPYAYSALLAMNRSIPPQVKNNWNNQLIYPNRGGGYPGSAELNYWRSMPPEVRNNIVRQQQQQRGYPTQPHTGHIQPPPVVIYVPAPSAPVPHGAGATTTAIPAPPPPSELPRIIRPN